MAFDPLDVSFRHQQYGPVNMGRLLGVAAFLTLPIALFASKGLAPLFIVTALMALALSDESRRIYLLFPRSLSMLVAAFASFAAISAIWSIDPGSSLRSTLIIGLTGFGGLVLVVCAARLEQSQREFFEKAIVAGGAAGLIIILFEHSTDWTLTRFMVQLKGGPTEETSKMAATFNAGMAICAIYFWPWLLVIQKKFGFWPMLSALCLAVLAMFMGSVETPLLAMVIGIVVAMGSYISRKKIFVLFATLIVMGTLSAPLLPGALPNPETETSRYPSLSHSALHRLSIWRTAGERISEHPVLGFGMNATRHLYDKSDRVKRIYDTDNPDKKSWYNNFEPIPLHTHNGILQIWLELGGVGALLFLAVLLAILKLAYERTSDKRSSAAALGMMTSVLFIYSASFGPWQSWWHAGLWLLAGFMVAIVKGGKEDRA